MKNKFFLIRVSLAEGTRARTDMSDHAAATKIAEFAEMLFTHQTEGPMKPLSAGYVIDPHNHGDTELVLKGEPIPVTGWPGGGE